MLCWRHHTCSLVITGLLLPVNRSHDGTMPELMTQPATGHGFGRKTHPLDLQTSDGGRKWRKIILMGTSRDALDLLGFFVFCFKYFSVAVQNLEGHLLQKGSTFKTTVSPDRELHPGPPKCPRMPTALSLTWICWPICKNIYKSCIIHAILLMGQVSGVDCFFDVARTIYRCHLV